MHVMSVGAQIAQVVEVPPAGVLSLLSSLQSLKGVGVRALDKETDNLLIRAIHEKGETWEKGGGKGFNMVI